MNSTKLTSFVQLICYAITSLIGWQLVETERYRSELVTVRTELEPWEKELIVHKGKLEVASSESRLLSEKVGFGKLVFPCTYLFY